MTVGELLESIDSVEISEWMAYFSIENERYEKKKTESELKAKAAENVRSFRRR